MTNFVSCCFCRSITKLVVCFAAFKHVSRLGELALFPRPFKRSYIQVVFFCKVVLRNPIFNLAPIALPRKRSLFVECPPFSMQILRKVAKRRQLDSPARFAFTSSPFCWHCKQKKGVKFNDFCSQPTAIVAFPRKQTRWGENHRERVGGKPI